MEVHLVDGTYELFRHFFAPRPGHLDSGRHRGRRDAGGRRRRCSTMLEGGRDPRRRRDRPRHRVVPQRPLGRLQDRRGHRPGAVRASSRCSRTRSRRSASRCGRWSSSRPTTRSRRAARVAAADERVEQVIICTPDKDLAQCVGGKVVQLDRRKDDAARRRRRAREVRRAARVDPRLARARGRQRRRLPRPARVGREVGRRGARPLRAHRGDPDDAEPWDVDVRGADRLAATLAAGREVAELFKVLATLRTDADVGTVDDWEWTRPDAELRGVVRAARLAATRRPAPRRWRSARS